MGSITPKVKLAASLIVLKKPFLKRDPINKYIGAAKSQKRNTPDNIPSTKYGKTINKA